MNHPLLLTVHRSYALVFSLVLAESLGFPVTAALALIAAGAATAAGTLRAPEVIGLALSAMLAGDILLFFLGRRMGWALLGVLCRISMNPESCILRSAETFYKRGKVTLLFAKFVPGVNTMAPPLAGSMKMRFDQFLRFDAAGAALYIVAYSTLGFVFRDLLASITRGFQSAGRMFEEVLLVAAIAYVCYRIFVYRKNKVYKVVPRVQVEELARRLSSQETSNIMLVDVRSHGYYDPDAARIKGSVRLEPNQLAEEVKTLPKNKDIYLYCT